jgi:hypothetical protein
MKMDARDAVSVSQTKRTQLVRFEWKAQVINSDGNSQVKLNKALNPDFPVFAASLGTSPLLPQPAAASVVSVTSKKEDLSPSEVFCKPAVSTHLLSHSKVIPPSNRFVFLLLRQVPQADFDWDEGGLASSSTEGVEWPEQKVLLYRYFLIVFFFFRIFCSRFYAQIPRP